jgi:hypothetical protein
VHGASKSRIIPQVAICNAVAFLDDKLKGSKRWRKSGGGLFAASAAWTAGVSTVKQTSIFAAKEGG